MMLQLRRRGCLQIRVLKKRVSNTDPQFRQPLGSPGFHLLLMYEFESSLSNFQS